MFECRLNEFVVEILQEYNAALGLNNPPPTAQLLNAMATFVKQNTIKSLNLSVDEESATVKAKAEFNDGKFTESVVDISFLKYELDAYDLAKNLEGSDTVVVDINEAGDKIEIHLDSEVVAKIDRALLMPVSAPLDIELVAVDTAKQQRGLQLSTDFNISGNTISNRTRRVNVVIEGTEKTSGDNTDSGEIMSFSMLIDLNELEYVRDNVVELVHAALTHPSFKWYEDYESNYFTPISWLYVGNYVTITYYDQANDRNANLKVTADAVISEIEIE